MFSSDVNLFMYHLRCFPRVFIEFPFVRCKCRSRENSFKTHGNQLKRYILVSLSKRMYHENIFPPNSKQINAYFYGLQHVKFECILYACVAKFEWLLGVKKNNDDE